MKQGFSPTRDNNLLGTPPTFTPLEPQVILQTQSDNLKEIVINVSQKSDETKRSKMPSSENEDILSVYSLKDMNTPANIQGSMKVLTPHGDASFQEDRIVTPFRGEIIPHKEYVNKQQGQRQDFYQRRYPSPGRRGTPRSKSRSRGSKSPRGSGQYRRQSPSQSRGSF